MSFSPPILSIGALATEAGVNVETIRFYQRKNLLGKPERPYGGIRRYGQSEVARVRFIKTAQRLGFTLDEIAQLLQLDDGTLCSKAKLIGEKKLADVRQRLTDLRRIEVVLADLVGHCTTTRGKVACPLIVSLQNVAA